MSDPNSNTSAAEYSLSIGWVAAALASIIYSLKHVKKSKCCAGFFSCEQEPTVLAEQPIEKPEILNHTNV